MKEIKVLEWNINQRGGFGKGEIPYWIKDKISYADIVVLTEFCIQCDGRTKFINDLKNLGYHCVTSENFTGNDIFIAVKSPLEISCCFCVPCYGVNREEKYDTIPENLFVDINCDGTFLTLIGVRIKTIEALEKRREQFRFILDFAKNIKNPVLITGDFNNHRLKDDPENLYNTNKIDCILKEEYHDDYVRKTPANKASCGKNADPEVEVDPCYALDHFITKGISIKEDQIKKDILWYDRSFVLKDKKTYKWGSDFQSLWPPFPDHAILKGTFILE